MGKRPGIGSDVLLSLCVGCEREDIPEKCHLCLAAERIDYLEGGLEEIAQEARDASSTSKSELREMALETLGG